MNFDPDLCISIMRISYITNSGPFMDNHTYNSRFYSSISMNRNYFLCPKSELWT